MRIVMMGTGTFAEPTFQALLQAQENVVGLVTQPERNTGRKGGSTRQTGIGMANIAETANIPVIQPISINTPEGLAALSAFEPELLVVAAYGQILKPSVIGLPPLGAINVHASLLPKYRGASPIAHAIWSGEEESGVTVIRITPGLDAGEMLAQATVEIGADETTGELEARLGPIGADLCINVIQQMKLGPVRGIAQDPAFVTKAPKLTKDQGQIHWAQSEEQVRNHIRAMQPWPTPYTFFHRPGKPPMRLIITKLGMSMIGPPSSDLTPGMLLPLDDIPLAVLCGEDTAVQVLELQPAGKKKMTAEEFVRGYPIEFGYRFGPEVLA